jgi:hypothetical protein
VAKAPQRRHFGLPGCSTSSLFYREGAFLSSVSCLIGSPSVSIGRAGVGRALKLEVRKELQVL